MQDPVGDTYKTGGDHLQLQTVHHTSQSGNVTASASTLGPLIGCSQE